MVTSILTAATIDLNEELVSRLTLQALAEGVDQDEIYRQILKGVEEISRRYETGEYFIADLIIAGEIIKDVIRKFPERGESKDHIGITILSGTVEHDIHDIAKNTLQFLLQWKGYNVIDLGVDVTPLKFLSAIEKHHPHILMLSGLLTVSITSMEETVEILRLTETRNKVHIIIGGRVDEQICRIVGADDWSKDINVSLKLCEAYSRGLKARVQTL